MVNQRSQGEVTSAPEPAKTEELDDDEGGRTPEPADETDTDDVTPSS